MGNHGSSQQPQGGVLLSSSDDDDDVDCQEFTIPNTTDQTYDIPCKLWTSRNNENDIRAVVLLIHGGMFSQGNCDSHPLVVHALVRQLGLAVLTVTFRDGGHDAINSTFASGHAVSDLQTCLDYLKTKTCPMLAAAACQKKKQLPLGVVGCSSGGWFSLNLCNNNNILGTKQQQDIQFCILLCPVANPHARAVYLKHCIEGTTSLATTGKDLYPYRHNPENAQRILTNQLKYFESFKHMAAAADAVQSNQNRIPTLMVLGSHDLNVPPQAVQNAMLHWAAKTIIIGDGAGHELQTTPPSPLSDDLHSYIPDLNRFLTSILKDNGGHHRGGSKPWQPWCT